jgi:CO/xanthine dehydrogenase FAD-binding subunit
MKNFEYHEPTTLPEACKLLKKLHGKVRVLAGGTDLIPSMYFKKLAPEHIVNIKLIPGINKIEFDDNKGLSLGPLVKLNDLIYSDTIKSHYPILNEVASTMASHQVRNLATIGGNLCNAAPSADTPPILIAMDTMVTLTGPNSKIRTQPLEKFFTGPGMTALQPGELLTSIQIPPIKPHTGMAYIKHSPRNALEIAVVGAAGLIGLEPDSEKCTSARIVIAACAPTPLRVPVSENLLVGKKVTKSSIAAAAGEAANAVKPITDVRACESYRREIVKVQCTRVLEEALRRAVISDIKNNVDN